jgi:glutathione peroxidase
MSHRNDNAFLSFHLLRTTTPIIHWSLTPQTEKGEPTPLSAYAGKVLLIVNTASKCGFTPQYGGLEALYKKIEASHPGEFVVLGFPCNQFGGQEPAADDKIQEFCQINYGVTFPIFGKTEVNGDNADPLWEYIKAEKPGLMGMKRVKWNFEKFLISRDGKVVERWASTKKPETLEGDVLKEIAKKSAEPVKSEL